MAVRIEPVVNQPRSDKAVPVNPVTLKEGADTSGGVWQRNMKLILEYRHPEYVKYKNTWERCLDCYEGEIEKIRSYLSKHLREHKDNFEGRLRRTFYLNYCEPVVDLFASYLFRRPPVRKPLGGLSQPYVPSMNPLIPLNAPEGPSESKKREPNAQDPNAQDPNAQDPNAQDPNAQDPNAQDPNAFTDPAQEQMMRAGAEKQMMQEQHRQASLLSYYKFLANQGPQRLAAFNELYVDADLRGNSLDRFMQETGTRAFIAGHVGVLVDAPSASEGGTPRTEAERKRRKFRPYLVRIAPNDIVDWELDSNGDFVWVRIKEETTDSREPLSLETVEGKAVVIYRTWTRKEFLVHKIDGQGTVTLLDDGNHSLGEVPLVIVYNKRKKSANLVGESSIDDISLLNLAILNWMSMLDEEVYSKCLSLLTLKRAAAEGSSADVEIGSNNILEYPEERPGYISPPTDPGEFIQKLVRDSVEEIYRIARMGGGGSGIKIQESKSGIAYAYEFNETNQALCDKADQLELAEMKIHRLFAKWYGMEFEGSVAYPDEFGVEDLGAELEFLIKTRSAITSLTAKRELEKRTIKKLLQNQVDSVIMARIMSEIDSNQAADYKVPGEFIVPGQAEATSPAPFGPEASSGADPEVSAIEASFDPAAFFDRQGIPQEGAVPKKVKLTKESQDRQKAGAEERRQRMLKRRSAASPPRGGK